MFSARVQADLAPNRLARAVERACAADRPILDLTESNPTRAGFDYPADLLAPLGDRGGLVYSPQPLGAPAARCAVAADYARRGLAVRPDHLVLTASTSEAYSLLFKVLCDPGDEVLVPRPSYPLFEHLTRLDAVTAVPYDLDYHGAWTVDLDSVERAFSGRTRAVLVVSPNNPTGSFVKQPELDRIAALGALRDAAVIVDEVFADYELVEGAARQGAQVLTRGDVLVFSLGGLSKSVGLPQVKLGWIAVGGPPAKVEHALARLEVACDTCLSVSTPAQLAAAALLERGAAIRRQIQSRVSTNYRHLMACAEATPSCQALRAEGGWSAVVHVPSLRSEEELVLGLLEEEGVLIHPGYFFDFPRESFLVLSLLVSEPVLRDGTARVFRHFDLMSAGLP